MNIGLICLNLLLRVKSILVIYKISYALLFTYHKDINKQTYEFEWVRIINTREEVIEKTTLRMMR